MEAKHRSPQASHQLSPTNDATGFSPWSVTPAVTADEQVAPLGQVAADPDLVWFAEVAAEAVHPDDRRAGRRAGRPHHHAVVLDPIVGLDPADLLCPASHVSYLPPPDDGAIGAV